MTPLTLCARSGDLHNPFLDRVLGYCFGLSRRHAAGITDKQLSQEKKFPLFLLAVSLSITVPPKRRKQPSPPAPMLGQVSRKGVLHDSPNGLPSCGKSVFGDRRDSRQRLLVRAGAGDFAGAGDTTADFFHLLGRADALCVLRR
jgi:hypothetical protein